MLTFIKKVLFGILDTCFSWFSPGWRRRGYEQMVTLRRYVNMRRHAMDAEKVAECEGRCDALSRALLNWDEKETLSLLGQTTSLCSSLRGYERAAWVEMVESFFIIMVVFLGIRTYYAQPFRIPTGSMQPSLNGIIVKHIDEMPSLAEQILTKITHGSSYIEAVAPGAVSIQNVSEFRKWVLFTETVITFNDGSKITIPSAKGAVLQYLRDQGKIIEFNGQGRYGSFKAGETIMRARVDAGDMVIVNRMSYHFRKPKRGETFVFDTRGINVSMSPTALSSQADATHYIKRLCGLPGDTLFVKTPNLLINGEPAKEETIARVAAGKPPFNATGYQQLSYVQNIRAWMTNFCSRTLNDKCRNVNLREYAALGDNTTNSLDSRYWGPVRQFNIVGPATFALWPFTEHWGLID